MIRFKPLTLLARPGYASVSDNAGADDYLRRSALHNVGSLTN